MKMKQERRKVNKKSGKARLHQWAKTLLKNGVDKLVAQARLESTGTSKAAAVETELGYFIRNAPSMK